MQLQQLVGAGMVALVFATPSAVLAAMTKIVSFGDSFADTGNGAAHITTHYYNTITSNSNSTSSNIIPSPDTYFHGRFSNGPVYVEHVSRVLGLDLESYAVGGSGADDRIIQGWLGGKYGEPLQSDGRVVAVPDMMSQVETYLLEQPLADMSQILFTLWTGNDDEYNIKAKNLSYSGHLFAEAQYEAWVKLAESGAKNILAVVPPPRSLFSFTLGSMLEIQALRFKYRYKNHHVRFHLLHLPLLFANIKLNPVEFGFTETQRPCCEKCMMGDRLHVGLDGLEYVLTANICNDPDAFVMWDQYHLSAKMHRLIGERAVDVIRKKFYLYAA